VKLDSNKFPVFNFVYKLNCGEETRTWRSKQFGFASDHRRLKVPRIRFSLFKEVLPNIYLKEMVVIFKETTN